LKKHIDFIPITFITTPDEIAYFIPGMKAITPDGIKLQLENTEWPLTEDHGIAEPCKELKGRPSYYQIEVLENGVDIMLYPVPDKEYAIKFDAMFNIKGH
jgi:hypothetical protein